MTRTLRVPTHTYEALLEMSTVAANFHVAQPQHRSTESDTKLMQDVAPDHKHRCNVLHQIMSIHGRSRTTSIAA